MPKSKRDTRVGKLVRFHEPMFKTVRPDKCNVWHLRYGIIIDVKKKMLLILCEGRFFDVNHDAVSYDIT